MLYIINLRLKVILMFLFSFLFFFFIYIQQVKEWLNKQLNEYNIERFEPKEQSSKFEFLQRLPFCKPKPQKREISVIKVSGFNFVLLILDIQNISITIKT